MRNLVFLKLGGSLITDKYSPRTAREDLILRVCQEIGHTLAEQSNLKLLLGHGSGSFGHYSGKKHGTRNGVSTPEEWQGYSEVRQDAAALNQLVMDGLKKAGLQALGFPPSGSVTTENRKITSWDLSPIYSALDNNQLPVVYGDVVLDTQLGGTILSTEELFLHLSCELKPGRILLAGIDRGVWEDYPNCTKLIREINPANFPQTLKNISSSGAPDVTGGMAAKVSQMVGLIDTLPDISIQIFSGMEPDNITRALSGEIIGTTING